MFGLQIIDIVVIVLYFSWLIWIGFRSMKKIHNEEDFFLGGRKFGKLIATFSMFGQATSGESGSAAATQMKQMGIAGIMVSTFPNFFQLPTFFFSAKWMRRIRLMTMASYYEDRYQSKVMGAVYAVSQAIFFIVVIALAFMAISKTVQAMTPKPYEQLTEVQQVQVQQASRLRDLENTSYITLNGEEQVELQELREIKPQAHFSYLDRNWLIFGLAIVILIYAVGGGLEAAAKTDVIQSIFLLMMTVLLLPAGLAKVNAVYGSTGFFGAFESMHKALPQSVFELLGSAGNQMTWYLMAAMSLSLPASLCTANQLVAAGAAKDDRTAREGFINGLLLKRVATVIWGVIGMVILTIYATDMGDPDLLWGKATHDLLGPLNIGLVGLMTACLMSGLMSTADTHMLTVAAMLTDSVYKPLFPNRSQKHYVLVGRICSGLYLAGGVVLATMVTDFWTFFKYMATFNFLFGAPFLMGILWRRANRTAAWSAIIICGAISLLIPVMVSDLVREKFVDMTISEEITRTYVASNLDVLDRDSEILAWQELNAKGEAEGVCPAKILANEEFTKIYKAKEYAIFWDDINVTTAEDGSKVRKGTGLLKTEILMLDMVGVPLEKMPYAAIESLRFVIKFLLSFLPFIIVALFTRPQAKELLDQFYGKLRTPTQADHAADAAEMALTRANPTRFDDQKLFKNSDWEINRWDRYEQLGIVKIMVWVAFIYALLFAVSRIGA